MANAPDINPLIDSADPDRYGAKAARLSALLRAGLPTPCGFAISARDGARIAAEGLAAFDGALGEAMGAAVARVERRTGRRFGDADRPLLLSIRASAGPGASGAPAILNIGATAETIPGLTQRIGARAAADLRRRLIQSFATGAMGVDADMLEARLHERLRAADVQSESALDAAAITALSADYLAIVAEEADAPFPDWAADQLRQALTAMSQAWTRPRAKMMRAARGEDPEAGLALVVEAMALGVGEGLCGAGWLETRDPQSGAPTLRGAWLAQAQGEEAALGLRPPAPLTRAEGEGALEETAPALFNALGSLARRAEQALDDALRLEFTVEHGEPCLLDAAPLQRGPRAAVQIAVDLAEEGVIARRDALLRVEPAMLIGHLHPSIDPGATRDPIARGLAASPGAACGPIVFSAAEAEHAAAQERPAILVRVETKPEDIRGMYAAAGVLTMRGGLTSHAAVVARGLGVPCVVGATGLALDAENRLLRADDGRVFEEGDEITVDGGAGEALAGAARLIAPEISGAFARLMVWADETRRMRVRANADTPADAKLARGFNVDGIGLCRTEHMFFEKSRITVMREMILAETPEVRRAALERLLPWQRADFVELFTLMKGLPVTIRLLDPPLHEFLPHDPDEIADLAEATGLSKERVRARAAQLTEFNPMLGLRGCRVGVLLPEIYEMQARAIFEAALDAAARSGAAVEPEVMIPLVSARREIETLRARVDAIAQEVSAERGVVFDYKVGCMVETPRAALRAGEIARACDFLSFGTNDLTQMAYGLSRDDAGRFMGDYVAQEIFPADPFQTLDVEGVGELLLLAAERGRAGNAVATMGLCGEHGGDAASIRFCELAGFDYVSCSPYRAPIARLAAAQASLLARREQA